jgi:hypothetical protein
VDLSVYLKSGEVVEVACVAQVVTRERPDWAPGQPQGPELIECWDDDGSTVARFPADDVLAYQFVDLPRAA